MTSWVGLSDGCWIWIRHRLVVCQERQPRRLGSIEILPWREFVERLHGGEYTKE